MFGLPVGLTIAAIHLAVYAERLERHDGAVHRFTVRVLPGAIVGTF